MCIIVQSPDPAVDVWKKRTRSGSGGLIVVPYFLPCMLFAIYQLTIFINYLPRSPRSPQTSIVPENRLKVCAESCRLTARATME